MNTTLQFLKEQIGKEVSISPSPVMRWLKPQILEVAEGNIRMKYKVREEMCNPIGNLHGGMSSAIIDDAIGVALFSYGETHFHASVNLSIDFFSAVRGGEEVIAKAFIIKKGKQLVNARCEIWTADESRLVAQGTSNLIKTHIEK